MAETDEKLRTELMEAILEYFEGGKTMRSVLSLGITMNNSKTPPKNPKIAEVVSQLNSIGNELSNGKSFSYEYIKETFTSILEKLIRD